MTNKRNLPVLTDEEMAEKIRKSIENGERRMSDNRPKTYKGKQVEYRGEISDREPFTGKEEGIYYLISTGSAYCYYDGVGSLDLRFEPNPHNPEVADMKPCWYSEMKESEE